MIQIDGSPKFHHCVRPTPHFAIALSFSRMAFEMNLK